VSARSERVEPRSHDERAGVSARSACGGPGPAKPGEAGMGVERSGPSGREHGIAMGMGLLGGANEETR
jgi:hypothetical protein